MLRVARSPEGVRRSVRPVEEWVPPHVPGESLFKLRTKHKSDEEVAGMNPRDNDEMGVGGVKVGQGRV